MLRKITKTILFSLLSGILLALPFNYGRLWLLSWVSFIPLFILLENKSRIKAFLISYITGIIFWSGTIYWLIHVTLPGTILLVLYLALYFGFLGAFLPGRQGLSIMNFVCIPSLWIVLEYLRSHLLTGFPWALLGYSQYLNLPIIQISDITGAWGVSFLVIMVNMAFYLAIRHTPSVLSQKRRFLLPLFCLLFTLAYGYYNLYLKFSSSAGSGAKISVIQGNIAQQLKWAPSSRNYIIEKYLDISREAAKDKPDLIIWPEASLPVVLEEEPEFFSLVKGLAQEINTPLLLGALTSGDNLYYNSAILLSEKGKIKEKYNKLHLVPFGEYIPLRKTLRFMETIAPIGDIERGKEYTVFGPPLKFSVLICFEDLFPEISREFIKKGALFLVNITNDAWYKKTPAAFQHFQASVFRAVENRVFLVRAANTGVSGFIDRRGKAISLVHDTKGINIFVGGHDTQAISVSSEPFSFYTRYGDVFPAICFVFMLYGIIFLPKAKIRKIRDV